MPRIRILLSNLPRMLREILTGAALGQPDLELVDAAGDTEAVLAAVGRAAPHVVVVTGPHEARTLLPVAAGGSLQLLVVSPEGRDAELFEVVRRALPVRDLSPQALLAVARDAALSRVAHNRPDSAR